MTQKKVIKLLTYNVMAFGYKDHTKESPNPIIQYIADSEADIVCLQEFFLASHPNFLTQQKIDKALYMYPYHHNISLVTKKNYTIGLAIYSKYPILNSRKIRYDSAFNGSTVHEIDVNGDTLNVINNHLESFKLTTEDRSNYTDFLTHINMDTFDELRETVQQKLGTAFLIRAEQAEIVAEEIQKLNAKYLIVCGDYNDTPISYAYRVVKSSMGDAFADAGTGLGTTYNQHYFWFRIDHVVHTNNIKTYRANVDKIPMSDHYPMWCYLELQ
ncbi:MAG: endonuclease/exonuclease/phosphatase family protein [Tannerella sp.]|nr:endonuclease/exonuclease/phosphatase family protein [Tannerella sp.]